MVFAWIFLCFEAEIPVREGHFNRLDEGFHDLMMLPDEGSQNVWIDWIVLPCILHVTASIVTWFREEIYQPNLCSGPPKSPKFPCIGGSMLQHLLWDILRWSFVSLCWVNSPHSLRKSRQKWSRPKWKVNDSACKMFCAALHKHKSLCSVPFSLLGFTFLEFWLGVWTYRAPVYEQML